MGWSSPLRYNGCQYHQYKISTVIVDIITCEESDGLEDKSEFMSSKQIRWNAPSTPPNALGNRISRSHSFSSYTTN